MMFGEGSSPALAGDALIVVMDQEDESFIYALNKNTGEVLWKQSRDEDTSWATPAVAQVNGRLQAIVSATKLIRSYDVQTGELIWQCGGQTQNVIPSPIVSDGLVFCTSGFRGSELQAIELGHTGDLTGTKAVRWQVNKATPYVPSPILYGDNLYVCSMNKAAISCYHAATGRLNFSQENLDGVKDIYASPVGAAGRVYFVGRKGTTQVIANTGQIRNPGHERPRRRVRRLPRHRRQPDLPQRQEESLLHQRAVTHHFGSLASFADGRLCLGSVQLQAGSVVVFRSPGRSSPAGSRPRRPSHPAASHSQRGGGRRPRSCARRPLRRCPAACRGSRPAISSTCRPRPARCPARDPRWGCPPSHG